MADTSAKRQLVTLCLSSSLILSGCASVPRSPAGTLADAGVAATNAFSTDIRDSAAQIQYVDVMEAFTTTYAICSNPKLTCEEQQKPPANYKARQELAEVIKLRAKAIDALGKAYKSLKTEADYDARGDLINATNSAIGGVNNFAGAVAALSGAGPAAALIGEPLKQISAFTAGLIADRNQRKRLIGGSMAIAAVAERLSKALAAEAEVFEFDADYIIKNRTQAKMALLDAGLVSNSDIVLPLATNLGMKPMPNVDAIISGSKASKTAIRAVIAAQSRSEVAVMQRKYKAAIAALDALVAQHREMEADRNITLVDVDRFLGELDAALGTPAKDK
jgi:hypothetical protein